MASSRNASSSSDDLRGRVARALPAMPPSSRLLLGLSGGVDSVVLLELLAQIAPGRFSLSALHVHHGLSPNADAWAHFCAALCERLGVPVSIERVELRGLRELGTERAAREARYAAFNRHAADFLVLAHHRDDQAETLLLQLVRGAGVPGLAGMGASGAGGLSRVPVLRPLLEVARRDIEAFARSHGLSWIEDESNSDTALDRNFIRHRVLPVMEERFGSARATIARSAAHFGEAAGLLRELGRSDLERCRIGKGWDIEALLALGPARGRNALRALCNERQLPIPGTARLAELWRQIETAREDGRLRVAVGGRSFQRYRGTLFLEPCHAAAPRSFCAAWAGEERLSLPELGGVVQFSPVQGTGLSADKLRGAPVTVRVRSGGERLQLDAKRPRRTLKNLFQEQGIPPWRRDHWPLIHCGDALVGVPGVAEDFRWRAQPGEAGLVIRWQPAEAD